MRPDQDLRLTSIGIGEPTCEKCTMELYVGADDSVCNDCNLNPMKRGDAEKFMKDALDRESGLPLAQLVERNAIMNGRK